MKLIHISEALSLPLDATTQAIAWLGRRGSGKSYGSTKLAELLFDEGAQFVAIDPVGIWYGLRLGKDGKSKGLDIPIFGGLHGDIPLEASGGALIADVIVGRNISAVLDVSQFEHDADKAKFATAFADRFFFLKKSSPSAVHVFVEEAQEFIPQNIPKGEERMLHAWQRMIRLGRNYGIGVSMISQRPQDVNKKALNQAECLFCFQLTGPQERDAVKKWISEHGLEADLQTVLPQLKQGHAHVWSPVWLDFNSEVLIAEKRTFAAGSTPKVGAKPVKIVSLEPLELEQLSKEMAATIERQKANDPAALKLEIKRLSTALTVAERNIGPVQTKEVYVADPKAIMDAVLKRDQEWHLAVTSFRRAVEEFHAAAAKTLSANLLGNSPRFTAPDVKDLSSSPPRHLFPGIPIQMDPRMVSNRIEMRQRGKTVAAITNIGSNGGSDFSSGALKLLAAMLAYPEGLTRGQAKILCGFAERTLANYVSELSVAGAVAKAGSLLKIPDGRESELRAVAGTLAVPTNTDEVLELWRPRLNSGAVKLLGVLVSAHGKGIDRERVMGVTGFAERTLANYVSELSVAGLLVKPGQGLLAANKEALFL